MVIDYKFLIQVLVYVVAGIFLCSFVLFYMSVRPHKYLIGDDPEELGLDFEKVEFKTGDNINLKGLFFPKDNTKKAIIVGHGYPFSKENVLDFARFLHKDYNLLFFDFRYFGESEGFYTTVGIKEKEDILAAVKFLKKKNLTDIGALGISMSAAAIIMSESPDIKAVVSDASYDSLDNMIKRSFWVFPGPLKAPFVAITKLYARIFLGIDTAKESPMKSLKNITAPILFIHGEKDNQISPDNSRALHEAYNNSELWIVEGAGHVASHFKAGQEYEERVLSFFNKHLS